MNQTVNRIKYGQMKAMSFIIDQSNDSQKKMVLKCIQHIMKENLLLLKDSFGP